jgi:hypothetical protein
VIRLLQESSANVAPPSPRAEDCVPSAVVGDDVPPGPAGASPPGPYKLVPFRPISKPSWLHLPSPMGANSAIEMTASTMDEYDSALADAEFPGTVDGVAAEDQDSLQFNEKMTTPTSTLSPSRSFPSPGDPIHDEWALLLSAGPWGGRVSGDDRQ